MVLTSIISAALVQIVVIIINYNYTSYLRRDEWLRNKQAAVIERFFKFQTFSTCC